MPYPLMGNFKFSQIYCYQSESRVTESRKEYFFIIDLFYCLPTFGLSVTYLYIIFHYHQPALIRKNISFSHVAPPSEGVLWTDGDVYLIFILSLVEPRRGSE